MSRWQRRTRGGFTVKSELVAISSLSLDPANVRKHPDKNIQSIIASLKRFGQQKPIVVDANGIVRAGNGTLMAAQQLGYTEIAIVRSPLKGSEATAYAIADNRTAELAEWDEGSLAEQLAALQIEDEELALATGFDEADIDALLAPDEVIEDEVPEPPAVAIAKRGDVWLLGEHRVMCGDSTSADDVARLMNGAKADLCFTSPPYALGKSVSLSGNKSMSAKANAYDDYEDAPEDWYQLMSSWFSASKKYVNDVWVINVQPLAGNKRNLVKFIADNSSRLVDFITWDKGHAAPVIAAGVMSSRFEWMLIFSTKENASRAVPLSSWRGRFSRYMLRLLSAKMSSIKSTPQLCRSMFPFGLCKHYAINPKAFTNHFAEQEQRS